MSRDRRLAVIGGGISGLAAAWELCDGPRSSVVVFESAPRLGGKIRSSPFAGRIVDEGADAFLRRVPHAMALATELGIAGELVSPATRHASVWIDGALRPIPSGLVMGVPLDTTSLESAGILSPASIARVRAEPELNGAALVGDATVGAVIRSRFGDEVLERLVGPLVGGINAGEPDEMSIDAVVPQLAAAAHRHRSLTVGLRHTSSAPDGAPVFAAPPGGMETFIAALATALRDRGVEFHTATSVDAIEPAGTGWSVIHHGGIDEVDGVVITTPATAAARLVAPIAPSTARHLASIEYASVAMVTLAYRPAGVPCPLDGSGFLVPRGSGLGITAVSWASSKWAHLGGGDVIVRVSAGHHRDPSPLDLDDDDLVDMTSRDLHTTMGIDAPPTAQRVSRFVDGLPQYAVGHLERIASIEADLATVAPGVVVTGAASRGVGIPACIREGRAAADSLRRHLVG